MVATFAARITALQQMLARVELQPAFQLLALRAVTLVTMLHEQWPDRFLEEFRARLRGRSLRERMVWKHFGAAKARGIICRTRITERQPYWRPPMSQVAHR